MEAAGIEQGVPVLARRGELLADRQRALRDGGGVRLGVRGGDARGVPRDHERGHHRPDRRAVLRGELGPVRRSSRRWRTTGSSRWSASRRSTTPCAGSRASSSASTAAGGVARPALDRHRDEPTSSTCSCRSTPARTRSRRPTPATSTSGASGRTTKLPDDVVLVPGVVGHATNVIEHPQLVADRIGRFVDAVGAERVIAATDCGLGGRVHPQIAWAKLEALAQGAELRLGAARAAARPRPWPGRMTRTCPVADGRLEPVEHADVLVVEVDVDVAVQVAAVGEELGLGRRVQRR